MLCHVALSIPLLSKLWRLLLLLQLKQWRRWGLVYIRNIVRATSNTIDESFIVFGVEIGNYKVQ